MIFINDLISRNAILCFLIFFSSCRNNENKIGYSNYDDLSGSEEIISQSNETSEKDNISKEANYMNKGDSLLQPPKNESDLNTWNCYKLSEDIIDNNVYYLDTVTVQTTEELIQQIRSNRLIRLIDKEYILRSSSYYQGVENEDTSYFEQKQGLLIDSIKNLKIVGTGSSKLLAYERNATVLNFSNSYNIHLDKIIIGHTESPGLECQQGVLRISHSYNIDISNCKLFGSGTFGLVTYDVYNLNFSNSEITECTALIFELEKSRKVEFKNSKFHNNHLATSVLGGFTTSTKEISFLNCEFLDNKPDMVGNPVFNFFDNYKDFNDLIIFTNCTFKNNKGYKWYGEKIRLDNCKIDSTDFIGLRE